MPWACPIAAADNDTNILYTPAPGFAGVEVFTYTVSDGNDGYASATVSVTVTEGIIPTVTLTVAVDGAGSGTVEPGVGPHVYELNTVVTLTATADLDSEFVGWSGGVVGTSSPVSITMTGDVTVTATFDLLTHTLTVNTAGDGSGTVDLDPAGGVYTHGVGVTLTATANPGSYFGGWTGDLLSANSTETLVIDEDKVVTATFSTEPPVTYTLTVHTVGSGTVDPAGGTYISGTAVILTATPDPDWQFVGWSGGVISTSNPVSITMAGDVSVTATFELLTHTLTVNTAGDGTGTVDLDPPGGVYDHGDSVTLTATPDLGSYFGGWTGDLFSANNTETLVIDEDKEITATFSTEPPVTYTLTVHTVGSGTVDPAGGTYISGTAVILTAFPDPGWQFDGWSGGVISTSNPVSITMAGDVMVTATFRQTGFKIYLPLVLRD